MINLTVTRQHGWRALIMIISAFASATWCIGIAHAQERPTPFVVGNLQAEPGTRVSGYLTVNSENPANNIPITIINGAEQGPTLALIAGVHGSEYVPIVALQTLRATINPEALNGRIILVHLANPESFFSRTVYYHPGDRQNLNRQFPGNVDGTITAQIAATLTKEVIDRADYLVDMHAGDGNEQLAPYIYMLITGDDALDEKIKKMALAFGIDTILKTDVRNDDRDNPQFTDVTAAFRGVPAITTETGQLGETGEASINLAINGVFKLMEALKMRPSSNTIVEYRPHPELSTRHIRWLDGYEVITAPTSGAFHQGVDAGSIVVKDAIIGEIRDVFGEPLNTIKAPFNGWVNYIVGTPPITKGEPIVMISRISPQNTP